MSMVIENFFPFHPPKSFNLYFFDLSLWIDRDIFIAVKMLACIPFVPEIFNIGLSHYGVWNSVVNHSIHWNSHRITR